ncbi:MAG TPA: SUMF1/EgtB/PvdO family nonheme iron enzyme, partial [Opitutales bacterium]|nr:SUMF1/EgtB/PvdO family nonheme iron enzyme [Opitutales bacterium]
DYLTAQPLNIASQAAENAATAALIRQDWATAQQNFQQAYDLQQRLNREFPLQSFNDSDRLLKLDQQLAGLRSLPEYQQIQKSIAAAQAADQAGQSAQAAQYYQDAKRRQEDLNTRYPDSRFADPKQVTLISVMLDTSLSRPLANDIKSQAAAIFDELRNRHADQASASLPALYEKTTNFHQAYPQSTLLDTDLQNRILYLYFKKDDLASIEDQVYTQILPVPRIQYWQMAKQEVTQSLYSAVVGGNPSRNPGPKLPVESVNWTEARDFCLKLSWIIARPVRLPMVEEFQAALGTTATLDLAATTWNFDNSGGQTHAAATKAPNANGFYDLLGNVSEWLELTLDEDEGKAPLSSVNALSPLDSIRSATINHIAQITRNPYTGFRFMVNMDDTIPSTPASKN